MRNNLFILKFKPSYLLIITISLIYLVSLIIIFSANYYTLWKFAALTSLCFALIYYLKFKFIYNFYKIDLLPEINNAIIWYRNKFRQLAIVNKISHIGNYIILLDLTVDSHKLVIPILIDNIDFKTYKRLMRYAIWN